MKNSEIKEVLIDIRDNRLGNDKVSSYICNCFKTSESDVHDFFLSNRPSRGKFEEFTKSKYWTGDFAWWSTFNHRYSVEEVLEEKKRFLTALIEMKS